MSVTWEKHGHDSRRERQWDRDYENRFRAEQAWRRALAAHDRWCCCEACVVMAQRATKGKWLVWLARIGALFLILGSGYLTGWGVWRGLNWLADVVGRMGK